eukprot:c16143_g1_i1 orf=826-1926(+)
MLGKRPCLLRTSSSRSLLIPCDDAEGEPASFCQVTRQDPSPALSSPCKIVIGFEVGNEKKPPPDVCESPRSVLDMPVVLPQEKQQIVSRSPRSGLGTLLTANSGSVGIEIVAHIQSEEVDVHAPVVPIAGRQAPVHLEEDMEDEWLDADISPRRIGAACIHLKQNVKYNFNGVNTSPCQSEGLHADPGKGLTDDCMDADISPQQSLAPWQSTGSFVSPIMGVDNDSHISAQQREASHAPAINGMVDDCMIDHISTWKSEAPCVHPYKDDCTDACITPWQGQESHYGSLDMEECDDICINKSIFSAASPPSYPHRPVMSFLSACAFCGHSLRLGKDIYMYRGDQAFCSSECRYQKIAFDEHKEKRGS